MKVTARASAKVNLCLRVLGKRDDGFHEIESVMQSVGLHDEVIVESSNELSVSIVWAPGLKGELPGSPDLCAKAAETFLAATHIQGGAHIDVVKSIPIGSGLGGGSADAAATLVALDALYGTALEPQALEEMGAKIGSDVAFCVRGGIQTASGRGEMLSPLRATRPLWWVLGLPPRSVSTSAVYGTYDMIWQEPSSPCKELADALEHGATARIASLLSNDLEEPAFQLDPDLERLKQAMVISGALEAVMSGSGSAIAGLCMNEGHAREVAQAALLSFKRVEVVCSVDSGVVLS